MGIQKGNQIVHLIRFENRGKGRHIGAAVENANGHVGDGQPIANVGQVRPTTAPVAAHRMTVFAACRVEEFGSRRYRAIRAVYDGGGQRLGGKIGQPTESSRPRRSMSPR